MYRNLLHISLENKLSGNLSKFSRTWFMLLLQVKEELVKMRNEHSGELWKGVHHASTLHVSTTHKLIFIRVHKHTLMIFKHAAKLFWIWTINTNSLKTDGKAITYSIRYESLFQFIVFMRLYYVNFLLVTFIWFYIRD